MGQGLRVGEVSLGYCGVLLLGAVGEALPIPSVNCLGQLLLLSNRHQQITRGLP